ncbi:hypothetical protein V2W45_1226792, partial [Cenococcum geophilum]
KPLFHQLAAQNNGGAIFYSPTEVQQARDLLTEQEEAKKRKAALKANKKI